MKKPLIYKMIIDRGIVEFAATEDPFYYMKCFRKLEQKGENLRLKNKYTFSLTIYGLLLGNLNLKEKNNKYYLKYENKNPKVTKEYIEIIETIIKPYNIKLEKNEIPYEEILMIKKNFYTSKGKKKKIPENLEDYMSMEFMTYVYLELGSIDFSMSTYIFDFSKFKWKDIRRLQKNMDEICEISTSQRIKRELHILGDVYCIHKLSIYLIEIRRKWWELMKDTKYIGILGLGEEGIEQYIKENSNLPLQEYKKKVKEREMKVTFGHDIEEINVALKNLGVLKV